MNRRAFVTGLGALLAAPFSAETQQAKIPKIGVLSLESPTNSACVDALQRGLNELGYVEGKTYVAEVRWADDRIDLLSSLAADLVRAKVDIIVSASGPAAVIWKEATTSIPVVLASSFYPVESGVIASLAHPGGNVTGVTHFTPELMAKRVQLFKEVAPKASRFAVVPRQNLIRLAQERDPLISRQAQDPSLIGR
jgi:putative ABC transport system substrate-binding protein